MKHRISRRAFLNGCTLLAAAAAVGSLTSCGGKEAKDSGLAQLVVGSDTYPPYICRIVLGGDFSDFVTRWHPMGR